MTTRERKTILAGVVVLAPAELGAGVAAAGSSGPVDRHWRAGL